jgi:hypothetical protein
MPDNSPIQVAVRPLANPLCTRAVRQGDGSFGKKWEETLKLAVSALHYLPLPKRRARLKRI